MLHTYPFSQRILKRTLSCFSSVCTALSARPLAQESPTRAISINVSPVLKSARLFARSRIAGSLPHRIMIFLLRPNLLTSRSNVLDPPTLSLGPRRSSDCGRRRSQHASTGCRSPRTLCVSRCAASLTHSTHQERYGQCVKRCMRRSSVVGSTTGSATRTLSSSLWSSPNSVIVLTGQVSLLLLSMFSLRSRTAVSLSQ